MRIPPRNMKVERLTREDLTPLLPLTQDRAVVGCERRKRGERKERRRFWLPEEDSGIGKVLVPSFISLNI